jgi:ABC-2 type transport system ATP-binding protein
MPPEPPEPNDPHDPDDPGRAPALELRGAARSVGRWPRARRAILEPLDLRLARGRTLGLAGPNGSGKTTLLRLVAGIDRPDAGTVRVLGHAAGSRAALRAVGYLAEDSRFPAELTAREALALLGSLSGIARRDVGDAAERGLARVGLAQHARKRLTTFSRGMLRRFGLAQAFLHEPELVLLDEPTAGLDAEGFAVLDELLAGCRARGAAVVIASHLVGDLVDGADELALVVGGRLAAHGTPDELFAASGRAEVSIEGLTPAALRELEAWIETHGARVTGVRPAAQALADLYRGAGRSHDTPRAAPDRL